MAIMERVTGIGGVFQRAGHAASLRDWYAEHLGIDISDWGAKPSTSDGRSRRSW
jgi:hypothetical protein